MQKFRMWLLTGAITLGVGVIGTLVQAVHSQDVKSIEENRKTCITATESASEAAERAQEAKSMAKVNAARFDLIYDHMKRLDGNVQRILNRMEKGYELR